MFFIYNLIDGDVLWIFSETVKKRVEEFEKINIIDKGLPVDIGCGRVTRTKTRAMVAASAVTDATVSIEVLKFYFVFIKLLIATSNYTSLNFL